jgi:hypothetical protein
MADIEERIERMEAVLGKNPDKLVTKPSIELDTENSHDLW